MENSISCGGLAYAFPGHIRTKSEGLNKGLRCMSHGIVDRSPKNLNFKMVVTEYELFNFFKREQERKQGQGNI